MRLRMSILILRGENNGYCRRKKKTVKPSPDFPFERRYVSVGGYRIGYVESGEGDPVLFIHGNPTSSYLWRNILPKVASDTGCRGIALDLLGFGGSNKPVEVDYSIRLHADIVKGSIEQLDIKKLVLVLHGWGGPLGAAYAINHPENIRGIAFMETFLWPLVWKDFGNHAAGVKLFRSPLGRLLIQVMNIFVNYVMHAVVMRKDNMTEEVMHHYREPFTTIGSRKAIRAFSKLLPIEGKPMDSDAFLEDIQQRLQIIKARFSGLRQFRVTCSRTTQNTICIFSRASFLNLPSRTLAQASIIFRRRSRKGC